MRKAFTLAGATHVDMQHNIRKNAFTLAEVLITLGIIGIVAALTMPGLIANHKEKETVTKLRKVYSSIQQAFLKNYAEQGAPEYWDILQSNELMDMLAEEFNFVKVCAPARSGCWYSEKVKNINGSDDFDVSQSYSTAVLSDGTMIAICDIETDGKLFESTITDVYSQIIVDVNGAKAPNQFGTDVFLFELLNNRIVPRGLPEFSIGILSFEDFCYQHGHACAGWVIINGNTDYLKCSGLSWDVKTSCN